MRRDGPSRKASLAEIFDESLQAALVIRLEIEHRHPGLHRFETPVTDVTEDLLIEAAFVENDGQSFKPFGAMIQKPAGAPLLPMFLARLRQKKQIRSRHDLVAFQIDHRHQLRDGERFHVVGAPAVEVAQTDLSRKRRSLFPSRWNDVDDIDVVQEEKSAVSSPSGEPREEIAALRSGTHYLRFDSLAVEQVLEILRAGLLSLSLTRVDLNVVVQYLDFGHLEPLRGGPHLVALYPRGFLASAGRRDRQKDQRRCAARA